MNQPVEPRVGLRFKLKGSEFEICHVRKGIIRYASDISGQQYRLDVDKFYSLTERKEIILLYAPVNGQISTGTANRLLRIKRYIDAAITELKYPTSPKLLKPLIEKVSELIKDEVPPSPQTVARWINKYTNNGEPIEILNHKKGNRNLRFTIDVEILVNEAIDQVYMKQERREAKDVLAYIVGKLYEAEVLNEKYSNINVPNIRTIQRRLNQLDPYEVAKNKGGKITAQREYRASGHKIISDVLMNIVEIDTHFIDIIIIDKSSGEPLGRPYLTLITEIKTKVIVGTYISLYPPSTVTALAAIKDMLTRPNRGLKGGICCIIVPDGGAEFINCGLEKVCAMLLITILSSQAHEPNGKPHVESFFKTLTLGIIQKLEGTTFSSPSARGNYNSVKKAVFDLENVSSFIHEWIENVYHRSIHSSTKRMPIEHWNELSVKTKIYHLSDVEAEAMIRRPVNKTINNGRIHIDEITYYSHALKTLENQGLKKVTALVNDLNLNEIVVEHPVDKGVLIIAKSTEPSYTTNLTQYENEKVQEIKKQTSESDLKKHGKYSNLIALYKLMKRIHEESLNSIKKLKKVTNGSPKIGYADKKLDEIINFIEAGENVVKKSSNDAKDVKKSSLVQPTKPPIKQKIDENKDETCLEPLKFSSFKMGDKK